MSNKRTFKERWRAFILPYIHRAMEWCRADPNTSYEDWEEIRKQYKKAVGKDYNRPWNE